MKLNLQLEDLDEDTLDLTPLIDVLFLLLTFFILAASFVAPAMEVELAKAKSLSSAKSQEQNLIFSIDEIGEIYHDKQKIGALELKALLEAHPNDSAIVFNVDRKAPFESFVSILDEAKSQGKQKFLINGQVNEDPNPQ